jgi:hypothetical protein
MLVAGAQGTFGQTAAVVRCESSNSTQLQLVCPSQSATSATTGSTSESCDLQLPLVLPLATRGIALSAVAMEDYNNGGPAVRSVPLSCVAVPGPASSLDIRSASVRFEITNVVRPIFGDADFADGGNQTETRRVLNAGARFTYEVHIRSACRSDCFIAYCAAVRDVAHTTTVLFLSGAGQGTLEIITSRGGLLTLHSHPAFSSRTFVAPSAALIVRHPRTI